MRPFGTFRAALCVPYDTFVFQLVHFCSLFFYNRNSTRTMATGAQAVLGPGPLDRREPGWIYRKWWDLSLIIFSAVLVPMPLMFAWGAQKSGWMSQQQAIDIVNIAVAALIGGAQP